MNDVPAYGIAAMPLRDVGMAAPPHPVIVKGRSMSNGRLTLRWDRKGRLSVEDHLEGRVVADLVGWESRRDSGDLYTPSIGAPKFKPRLAATTVVHRGRGTGVVEQLWHFAAGAESIELRLRVALDAAASFLRIGILGDNGARDHRLRLMIRTDVARAETYADAAFGPVKRSAVKVTEAERRMETPLATAPLHRYVSVFNTKRGATLYSDGLTEYETVKDQIAVTLLRSVGELSRNDLKERPGHAGWPVSTPEAQCVGPFESEFGILLHGPRSETVIDQIERVADDVLFPLTGETLRSALALPSPIHGIALEGIGLAFSCAKESEDGEWLVLRCVNLLNREVAGAWRLGRSLSDAKLARLDETALTPLETRGSVVPFLAAPRAVVTILVR
jgi:mannosylglycerate hydrolase